MVVNTKLRTGILHDDNNDIDTFATNIVVMDKNIFIGIPAMPKLITGRRTAKTKEEVENPEIRPLIYYNNISHRMNKTLANLAGEEEKNLVLLGDKLNLNAGIKTTDIDILTKLNRMFRSDLETLMHIENAYNYYV
jgi:hypothetical protein